MKQYDPFNGPHSTLEICSNCKKKWTRHRIGINDIKDKPCYNCVVEEVIKENKELFKKLGKK